MGRGLTQDPLFFGAALAGGGALGELAAQSADAPARRGRRRRAFHGQEPGEPDAKLGM